VQLPVQSFQSKAPLQVVREDILRQVHVEKGCNGRGDAAGVRSLVRPQTEAQTFRHDAFRSRAASVHTYTRAANPFFPRLLHRNAMPRDHFSGRDNSTLAHRLCKSSTEEEIFLCPSVQFFDEEQQRHRVTARAFRHRSDGIVYRSPKVAEGGRGQRRWG
jgi:hypothetical protein